ncbi:MAG: tetratricopeptide repeat protein [Acidobacteriota bacterium]
MSRAAADLDERHHHPKERETMTTTDHRDNYRAWLGQPLTERGLTWARLITLGAVVVTSWFSLARLAVPELGASGLVSHPGLPVMVIVSLVSCYLAVRALLGAASGWSWLVLSGLQAVSLLVGPWPWSPERVLLVVSTLGLALLAARNERTETNETDLSGWPARLPALGLSVAYVLIALSELRPGWLSGSELRARVVGDGVVTGEAWALGAGVLLALHLSLAVLLHLTRWRSVTVVLGLSLHAASASLGLEPALLSLLALAVYLPLMPADLLPDASTPRRWVSGLPVPTTSTGEAVGSGWLGLVMVMAAGALLILPIEGMGAVVALVTALALVSETSRSEGRCWRALAHGVAALTIAGLHLGTDEATRLVARERAQLQLSGDEAEVLAATERLLFLDPSRRDLRLEVAEGHREAGNHERAESAYEAILDEQPGFIAGWIRLGRIVSEQERWEEALESYQRAANLRPGMPGIEVLQGLCLEKMVARDHPDVEGWPAGSRPDELSRAFVHYLEGAKGHRARGRDRRALHALMRAVSIERENAALCLLIGEVHEGLGQETPALAWVMAALERDPGMPDAIEARERLMKG